MKNKILLMMDTAKKKIGAAVLCGALVATIGSIPVFAAGSTNSSFLSAVENRVKSHPTDSGRTLNQNTSGDLSMNKSANGVALMTKVDENGVRTYSTDGNTWSKNVPDGIPAKALEAIKKIDDGKFNTTNE